MIPAETFNPVYELSKFYNGFFISESLGNNAFSFERRDNKKIYVAPLISSADLECLRVGKKIAFSEIHDGVELNVRGLKRFLYLNKWGKDIFIFDNHNHAFFFWCWALKFGRMKMGQPLVHVDQHKDLRVPSKVPPFKVGPAMDLDQVFHYTNSVLNVGNFIQPALALGIFSHVEMVDHQEAFSAHWSGDFVLDLDMDIFSKAMDYIDDEMKIKKIKEWIRQASLITIATSPFFMDQQIAIDGILKLLDGRNIMRRI